MTWQYPPPGSDSRWFAAGAPPQIKAMMLVETDIGKIAIEAVNTQVSLYNATVVSAQNERSNGTPSLFDTVVDRIDDILSEDPAAALEAISGLAEPIARRVVWKWERLSYAVLRAAIKVGDGTDQQPSWAKAELKLLNVDEWIAQNEKWLRLNAGSDEWKRNLVNFFAHADVIFDNSTVNGSSRKIIRPTLSGFYLLDNLRLPEVEVQHSVPTFYEKFAQLTNDQLRGLDWSNIFVAGPVLSESSDIDIYIYGLQPPEANKRIEHLFIIFKSNLPPAAEVLVVRNSKTITFFSQFPLRRLQIVLKIVKTPLDVLLSFDLDICAMGFDGQDVWMLPRAARALETGYNVFTMDMIQGHYLAERRATQEQRVFKYACKGYGIRILPSYIESLSEGMLDKKIQRGREWVEKVVQAGTAPLSVLHDDSRRLPLHSNGLPIVSHDAIDLGNKNTSEPGGRSCLTGFELFCRHVALWEAEQAEKLVVPSDSWRSTSYEDQVSGYNDSPRYKWDATFTLEGLKDQLRRFNDFNRAQADHFFSQACVHATRNSLSRSTFSNDLHEVLSPKGHIKMLVLVPLLFFKFANEMLVHVLKEKDLSVAEPLLLYDPDNNLAELKDEEIVNEDWAIWTIDENTMWQQLDRRIDEVYEVLWSLHHANPTTGNEPYSRMNLLKNQISRRSIRKTPADELGSFAQWVARAPNHPLSNVLSWLFPGPFDWEDDRTN